MGIRYTRESPLDLDDYAKRNHPARSSTRMSPTARARPRHRRPRGRPSNARPLHQTQSRQDFYSSGRRDERFHPPRALRSCPSHHARDSQPIESQCHRRQISSAQSARQAIASSTIGPSECTEPGDVLALWGAGAYGFAQTSNYNSRPRAAEVLVNKNKFRSNPPPRIPRAIYPAASD